MVVYRGRLVKIRNDSVLWRAPDSSGRALIGIEVMDRQGRKARDSLFVTVKPRVVVFAAWDGAVKGGNYVFLCRFRMGRIPVERTVTG